MAYSRKVLRAGIKVACQVTISELTRRSLARKESALREIRTALSDEDANAHIGRLLLSDKPCMIARFGSLELDATKLTRKMGILSKRERLATGMVGRWDWADALKNLEYTAGFFPVDSDSVTRFAQLMIDSMPAVDLLGSWVKGEGYFENELANATTCRLGALEPYYHKSPWSQYLEGKKVLVIHPFARSIQQQYTRNREELFQDPLVLPKFQLSTLQAIQTVAGNRPKGCEDWFSNLNTMFTDALAVEADVVILGCGAYGFPLAAMLKSAGKKVIHMGGATQILFGIKGTRWDVHPIISALYNDHWVRVGGDERPAGFEKVDGNGAYW